MQNAQVPVSEKGQKVILTLHLEWRILAKMITKKRNFDSKKPKLSSTLGTLPQNPRRPRLESIEEANFKYF